MATKKVVGIAERLDLLEQRVEELTKKVGALPNGEMMKRLVKVEKAVSLNSKNILGLSHDVNAIGHEISTVREQLGTDIVMSEERVVGAMRNLFKEITEGQGAIKSTLETRPCVMEEKEAAEKASHAAHKRHHTK